MTTIRWTVPPSYRCDACGAVADGCVAFPDDGALPSGWRALKRIYGAHAIDAPDGSVYLGWGDQPRREAKVRFRFQDGQLYRVELERHDDPKPVVPTDGEDGCICATIVSTDPSRHFKECPKRALYPNPLEATK